jgi:hypothetical protein
VLNVYQINTKRNGFLLTLCTCHVHREVIRILHFHICRASQFIVLEHLKQVNQLVCLNFKLYQRSYHTVLFLKLNLFSFGLCDLCIICKSRFWNMVSGHDRAVPFHFTVVTNCRRNETQQLRWKQHLLKI